jgi:uncharacterized protein
MNYIKHIFWNTEQVRIRTGYRALIEFLLKYLFSIGFGFGLFYFIPNIKLDPNIPLWLMTIYGIFIRLLPAIISVWLTGFLLDRRSFVEFGFHLNNSWRNDFFFGLGLGALLMTFIFAIEYSSGWVTIRDTFYTIKPGQLFVVPFLVLTVVFVCVGIGEEIISRGYLIKNFAEGFNFTRINCNSD